jgi:hypothetical protein
LLIEDPYSIVVSVRVKALDGLDRPKSVRGYNISGCKQFGSRQGIDWQGETVGMGRGRLQGISIVVSTLLTCTFNHFSVDLGL